MTSTICFVVACGSGLIQSAAEVPAFSDGERAQIKAYWAKSGRYVIEQIGESVVRQTAIGSEWLAQFRKELGYQKGQPPPKLSKTQAEWKRWVDSELERDRVRAERLKSFHGGDGSGLRERQDDTTIAPPQSLVERLGNPPDFYSVASPNRYTVTFADDEVFVYTDNVLMSAGSPYYRFPQGVMSGGTSMRKLSEEVIRTLLNEAGISESEARIFRAVSMLEGGFDSVNTYDTGYVSVGFIQFACLRGGAGSLGSVLQTLKRSNPSEFDRQFRRFGLDVHDDGRLMALDVDSGQEFVGGEAAMLIINDKRLTATFQRAGQVCDAFRVAQLRVAKDRYYPATDIVPIKIGPLEISVKVSDVIRSEAGLATLMDRKVNTGNIDLFGGIIKRIAEREGLIAMDQLRDFESEIIRTVRWRKDYLTATDLSQPRSITQSSSRSGLPNRARELPDFRSWW